MWTSVQESRSAGGAWPVASVSAAACDRTANSAWPTIRPSRWQRRHHFHGYAPPAYGRAPPPVAKNGSSPSAARAWRSPPVCGLLALLVFPADRPDSLDRGEVDLSQLTRSAGPIFGLSPILVRSACSSRYCWQPVTRRARVNFYRLTGSLLSILLSASAAARTSRPSVRSATADTSSHARSFTPPARPSKSRGAAGRSRALAGRGAVREGQSRAGRSTSRPGR